MAQKTFSVDGSFQTHPHKFNLWINTAVAVVVFCFSLCGLCYLLLSANWDGNEELVIGTTVLVVIVALVNLFVIYQAYNTYRNRNNTITVDAHGVEIIKRNKLVTKIDWKDVASIDRGVVWEHVAGANVVVGDMKLFFTMTDGTFREESISGYSKKGSMKNALKFYFEQSRK